MVEIPSEILWRRDEYCRIHLVAIETARPRGWGVDAYIWQTTADTILKVHYNQREFRQELAVYQRLAETSTDRLQGFEIPSYFIMTKTCSCWNSRMSGRPSFSTSREQGWTRSQPGLIPALPAGTPRSRLYGERWPEVVRLLDALRHLGIHYTDVHSGNICLAEPGDTRTAS
jgi:hypothetical protein